ncbi:MAG: hypothetical protein ABF893_13895 [Gluconacetobacter liquefaciens]
MTDVQTERTRLRKAWWVTVKGHDKSETYYAATAGKARMQAWYSIDSERVRIVDIVVRRNYAADALLPAPGPIAVSLSRQESNALLHAFGANGVDPTKAGCRDYFYTSPADPTLCSLVSRGLMKAPAGDKWKDGMGYFILSQAGREVALSLTPLYAMGAA